MSQKTVLITGGAGFIGSHLAEALLKRGDKVIVLDNFNDYYDPMRKRQNVEEARKLPHYSLIMGDIRDNALLETLFSNEKIDTVVHLAAMAGVRPSIEKPQVYVDVNLIGTTRLLEAMKNHGVKQLVFASSSSVYGNREKGPFAEDDRTDEQISPYGATKKAGELLVHTYAHLYGIKSTCLRFFTAYGPRNRPDMACFKFMDAIVRGKPIIQFGDGTTGRDYTFVGDIVQGIVEAIDTPFNFEIINLGNSSPVLLTELIQTMEEVVGKKAVIEKQPMQPGDVQLTFADISKAQKLLDYSPTTNLKEGLEKLFEWYQLFSPQQG